ncbi:MAG TPA: hypothetical protein VKA98_10290 [Nitrososphaeraceae archaeon]|nr:hypothetical protein [Nitrososphaeraceae archaeon]
MAPTDIACNNCASPSSSPADQISAKWKGKKWKNTDNQRYRLPQDEGSIGS